MAYRQAANGAQHPQSAVSAFSEGDWRRIAGFALIGLFLLGLCAALWAAQDLVIPIVLAVLVSYTLQPVHRLFLRARLPQPLAAALSIIITVGVIGGATYAMRTQTRAFIEQLPYVAQRVHTKFNYGSAATSAMSQVDRAAQEITGSAAPPEPAAFSVRQLLWSSSSGLFTLASQTIVVIVLTFYLLESGDLYKRKIVKIIGTRLSEKRLTVEILNDIERHVARYLAVRLVISAIVAVATWLAFWALGMPEPAVWGIAAGALNVIPYLGPITITATAAIAAVVQFDSLTHGLLVGAAAAGIGLAEGFGLTPILMGRASRTNGIAIFTALTCWGFLWGLWGLLLAVPMTMVVKVICDHVEGLNDVAELLGE